MGVLPILAVYGGLVLVLVGSYALLERLLLFPHCRSLCEGAELVVIAVAPGGEGSACFCADGRAVPTRMTALVPILAVAITAAVAGILALIRWARRRRAASGLRR